MYLEEEKKEKFYVCFFSLLQFTNNKYKINKELINKLNRQTPVNPYDVLEIREKLWSDNSIIDEYLKKNPDNFSKEDLKIIESWKKRVKGRFIITKFLKKHTIILGEGNVYAIVGLSNEISEDIPSSTLPIFVETVLLPFEDVIIYDSLIMPYFNIKIGGNIKRDLHEEYMEAKRKGKILYSLNSDNDMQEQSEENKTKLDKKYEYYEIKVTIKNTHPPVWRRLQIPANITFHELSSIIQIAFNWCGYHLYQFDVGQSMFEDACYISLPDEDFEKISDLEVFDASKEKIDKYFKLQRNIKYTYDFGDDWIHDVKIEKIVESDTKLKYPVCIKAKMAPLPEDCGGPFGYQEILEILDDPKHEQYMQIKKWIEEFAFGWDDDRTNVDIEFINHRLKNYKRYSKSLLEDDI